MNAIARYESALHALSSQNRLRALRPQSGIDFSSNDYLALAASPRLRIAITEAMSRGTAIGAGGSRLLRGNHPEHEELEAGAARFFHAERTLFFSSGYAANSALFATLPQSEDLVILDELIHASSREGVRSGRAASVESLHNDVASVEDSIRTWRAAGGLGQIWIAAESLYSMDGDRAPLSDLMTLADKHEAFLVIDEAHATGVFGPDGRGLAASLEGRDNVIVLHTCGKALGGAGALLSLPRVLSDFLVNRCRAFIFSTAPSPLMAVAALEALMILKEEPQRRAALESLVAFAGHQAEGHALPVSGSQIFPVIIGDDLAVMQIASGLRERGFDVRGVRPPTVPKGTARLRISITLNVTEAAIAGLFNALAELRG
ncbi:MAG TPA: 8-amino-7-oxononanoate synthase [Steroidobacteraceae bacterium]|nr:8-amino-7-oxononanoate synthase [Steroidobacteraceae bacterium]